MKDNRHHDNLNTHLNPKKRILLQWYLLNLHLFISNILSQEISLYPHNVISHKNPQCRNCYRTEKTKAYTISLKILK